MLNGQVQESDPNLMVEITMNVCICVHTHIYTSMYVYIFTGYIITVIYYIL